jgi:hypothetical protein
MHYKTIIIIILIILSIITSIIYLNKNKLIEMFNNSSQIEKQKYILSKNNIFNLLNQN